ncbi:hypothetical protein ACQBAU_00500 [Propionibacteriaceae bacterium Y2011]
MTDQDHRPHEAVVWWRRRGRPKAPSAEVDWLNTHTGTTGTITVPRAQLLDRDQVNAAVTEAAHTHPDAAVVPAHEVMTLLTAEQRLWIRGCQIRRVDLAAAYGIDVIAGLATNLAGDTLVAIETELIPPLVDRMCQWAEHHLDLFAIHNDEHRHATGWTNTRGRWQLLARQPVPDHTT